jgi:methionyl-tRNA synthetase
VDEKSGRKVRVSKESGHIVEFTSEKNFMFKLSEFKQRLKEYLNQNIVMPKKYQENLHFQIETLADLSVSREAKRISWGIPVNHIYFF